MILSRDDGKEDDEYDAGTARIRPGSGQHEYSYL